MHGSHPPSNRATTPIQCAGRRFSTENRDDDEEEDRDTSAIMRQVEASDDIVWNDVAPELRTLLLGDKPDFGTVIASLNIVVYELKTTGSATPHAGFTPSHQATMNSRRPNDSAGRSALEESVPCIARRCTRTRKVDG